MISSLLSKKAVSILLLTLLLIVPGLGFARSSLKTLEDVSLHSAQEIAHALFEEAVQSDTVPGISVAIAGRGGIIWAEGFGWADLENKVPVSTRTKMRIGSVAKPLTAAALMRLYEQGKVDLDKDIRSYVAAWPDSHDAVTLRQLTSHTAGIRHYEGNEFLSNQSYPTVTSSLDIFKDSPLEFAPGTGFNYSTYGWTLISAAMEGADGGSSFKQIMEHEVFNPLNMNDTAFDEPYEIIPNRQRPYSVQQGKLVNSPQTDHSNKWAAGGFIASTSDIARFAMAHIAGDYLNQDTVEQVFRKAKTNDGKTVDFGIGWQIGYGRFRESYADNAEAIRLMNEHPNSVMHSGGSMGGTTMMILCRDHDRAVVVVKNVSGSQVGRPLVLALKTLDAFSQHKKD